MSISTYSLNLLPPEDRKQMGRERMSRFFKLIFGITAALFLTGDVLLLPTYFFLFFEHKGIQQQQVTLEQNTKTEQAKTATARIEEINAQLKRFPHEYPLTVSPATRYLQYISQGIPPGIGLTSFAYLKEEKSITLRGKAVRRDDLLAFISHLRDNTAFGNVESPVTNLLKEEYIDFTITISLNGSSPKQ